MIGNWVIATWWNEGYGGFQSSGFPLAIFDFIRDIAPVAGIIVLPNVMVVNPSVPAATVPEFIAYAKSKPGKTTMASAGKGTPSHLAGELFEMMSGVLSSPHAVLDFNRSLRGNRLKWQEHSAKRDRHSTGLHQAPSFVQTRAG